MKKRLKKKFKKEKRAKIRLEAETKNGILAVMFFALAIISILSRYNRAGIFGQWFYQAFEFLFGWGYFLITLAFLMAAVSLLKSIHKNLYYNTILGILIFILSFLGILEVVSSDSFVFGGGGGWLGRMVSLPILKLFGFWAGLVILAALVLISIIVTFNISLAGLWHLIKKPKEKILPEEAPRIIEAPKGTEEAKKEELVQPEVTKARQPRLLERMAQKILAIPEPVKTGIKKEEKKVEKEDLTALKSKYRLPPIDLLESDKGEPTSGDIQANANIVQRTLLDFGIEVEMGEVNIGPTVTQYTFRPAQGVKLSKITALHSDLSLALAAHPIRIEAPIPGKSLVGIEIPNKAVTRVRLRNLLAIPDFKENHTLLTIGLGRDVSGRPIFADLEKMPHLLIAGATGTGKTICLNTITLSLLYRHSPEFLKLILIDPKRVEFPIYNGLPHLLTPVVTNAEKTINALRWAVGEMERRFEILSDEEARDIQVYNKRFIRGDIKQPLSYIIIIIDELADLMASHGREVEAGIVRLAQMARAVGIHLVVATQRPSVEVITGLIKANITSRIAFQVASQVDSRTILDMAGAEKLLGNGDMLFLSGDATKPKRIQGTYVSEKEVKRVADWLRKKVKPEYKEDLIEEPKRQGSLWSREGIDDELYDEAKEVVRQAGKASASLLQRRLRIGYARAARLLDLLEEQGVVGPADGAKPREVFKEDTD